MTEYCPSEIFPRCAKYDPSWIVAGASGGSNALCLTEWLSQELHLRPNLRVLDLGCGRASSSIFLRKEFGVQVWAVDLWNSAAENLVRIQEASAEDGIFPFSADARSLPFEKNFFDVIVCIDSIMYFGTDDAYIGYLSQFLKPSGIIGIAGAGLTAEIEGELPSHLRDWWVPELWNIHSMSWWRKHLEKASFVSIELEGTMQDGWKLWLDWQLRVYPDNTPEINALKEDAGRHLCYFRLVGRRG
jgi:cyclopropane fatty-acyl-phospholipid synthase-like methyltransferase